MNYADSFLEEIKKYIQLWKSMEISVVLTYKGSYWNLLALKVDLTYKKISKEYMDILLDAEIVKIITFYYDITYLQSLLNQILKGEINLVSYHIQVDDFQFNLGRNKKGTNLSGNEMQWPTIWMKGVEKERDDSIDYEAIDRELNKLGYNGLYEETLQIIGLNAGFGYSKNIILIAPIYLKIDNGRIEDEEIIIEIVTHTSITTNDINLVSPDINGRKLPVLLVTRENDNFKRVFYSKGVLNSKDSILLRLYFREDTEILDIERINKNLSKSSISHPLIAGDHTMNEEYPVLFICYSSADKSFVEKLIQDLRGVGVGVWYDKWEIRIGDSITQKIAEGIRSSSYLGIVLSKSAIESEWVNRELNSAIFEELERKKVYILPILKEKCEIPTLLKDKKYANMYENYDNGLNELIKITKRTSIFLDHPSILRKPIEIERKKSRIKENSIEKEIAHLLNKNLRLFCDPKPENEMDFQREIYKLLRSHNYFVSWNTDQTTFSGRGVKPDFSSKDINLAIEAKYLGTKTNINRIIEEMAADVTLYSKDYTNIIFVIYDRDQKISDREIFVKDFENRGNIIVIVI